MARVVGGTALIGDVTTPTAWVEPALGAGHHVLIAPDTTLKHPVEDGNVEAFDRLLRLQMSAPFELTSMLLPALTDANGAVVIFISSVQGANTYPKMAGYAGAKAGQVGMVKSLALELGPAQIRVLAVSPGYIDTRLMYAWADLMPDPTAAKAEANALHPMGRMGKPYDVGALVAFLASPDAEFVNGTNIVIDGGLGARYP